MMSEFKQIQFSRESLEKLLPELSFHRHLSVGIRSNLRNFSEYNAIDILKDNINVDDLIKENVVGKSIVRNKTVTLINFVTVGVVEDKEELKNNQYQSIYMKIEMTNGNTFSADEEMVVSQNIYNAILHSKLIPTSSLKIVNCGLSDYSEEEQEIKIYYPDLNPKKFDELMINDIPNYSFRLFSHVKVFFTNNITLDLLFDMCFISTIDVLSRIQLPRIHIKMNLNYNKLPYLKKKKKKSLSLLRPAVFIDENKNLFYPLKLEKISNGNSDINIFDYTGFPSNFGIVNSSYYDSIFSPEKKTDANSNKNIILIDLEGDSENICVRTRVSIIVDCSGKIKKLSIINSEPKSNLSLDILKDVIEIAKQRSNNHKL